MIHAFTVGFGFMLGIAAFFIASMAILLGVIGIAVWWATRKKSLLELIDAAEQGTKTKCRPG